MSPAYNDQGQVTGGDDLLTGAYDDVADHAAAAPPSRVGLGPEPKDAKGSDTPPLKPGWPVFDTLEKCEKFRASIPPQGEDPWHLAHTDYEFMQYLANQEWRLSGKAVNEAGQPIDPETGEPTERRVFANGQLLAPEDTPEVPVADFTPEAQEAGFAWDPAALEDAVDDARASGLPDHVMQEILGRMGAAGERFARDPDVDTPEAGTTALIRQEGVDRARQLMTDAQELLTRLAEIGVPKYKHWADSIAAVSNDPDVIRAAAQVYQELKNVPAGGPWEQILLGGAAKWAQQQSAAQARAAKAAKDDETPEDHVVTTGGRA